MVATGGGVSRTALSQKCSVPDEGRKTERLK
jgi:hypothetical protein